jgi:hypothetical protein
MPEKAPRAARTGRPETRVPQEGREPWRQATTGANTTAVGGCSVSLVDARSGTQLRQVADKVYGHKNAYLAIDACGVRVSAGT